MKRENRYYPTKPRYRLTALACFSVFLSLSAQAITRPPTGPQLMPQNPQNVYPTLPQSTPLTVEKYKPAELSSTAKIKIRQIKISGNTVFDTQTLHRLIADGEEKSLTLDQLNELASRISHYYQQHGYLVSRAYIPAQKIDNGIIYFRVLEARYDEIKVKNTSRLASFRIDDLLSPLYRNGLVESSVLNRNLLLLADIPGIKSHATLSPGKEVGTSQLLVTVEPGALFDGSVGVDDYGSRYTGRPRYNAALQVNNPTGQGDQLSLDGVVSGHNADLMYGHAGYQIPIYAGVTGGVNFSRQLYQIEESLDPLQSQGNQNISNIWISQPWIRNVNTNISSILRYSYKTMQDETRRVYWNKQRHSNIGSLENIAEWRDDYGKTNAYVNISYGNLAYDGTRSGADFDAQTAKTAGNFTKSNIQLSRWQVFTQNTSMYLSVNSQFASKNLDTSEQFVIGGPYSVRAYEVGAVSGSQGYNATAEFRYTLDGLPIPGSWTPMLFVDTGRIQVYRDNFTQDTNFANLSATGFGLDADWKGWNLSTRVAYHIGATPPDRMLSRLDSYLVWAQFSKTF